MAKEIGSYCKRCCSFGRCTPEGRVFVQAGDPDYPRLQKCPDCAGTGRYGYGFNKDNNPVPHQDEEV